MTRPDNWPELLHEHIIESAAKGFVWGENDCLFFAANWIEKLTGYDPVEKLRGKWSSAKSAYRYLSEHHASYMDAIQDAMGRLSYTEAAPVYLHRGDICAIESDIDQFGVMLGIVVDHRCVFISDDPAQPLVYNPRTKIKMGWRVV